MATSSRRLSLTRDQLALFLQDHEQIRQFERLFATVDTIAPDFVNEVSYAAGTAQAAAAEAIGLLTDLAQDTATNVAAAEAKAVQALGALQALQQQVDLLATAPPPREFKRARYGSFLDTTTQTATTINTAKAITFNTTDISRGVYIGSPTSRVYVDTEGVYDFQISIQLDSTVSTDEHFYLWLAKNGTDVANSASTVRLKGNNSESILSLNFFLDLKAGDYVELTYSVTNLGVQILYAAASPPVPAIPSVILTVNNGIEGVQ